MTHLNTDSNDYESYVIDLCYDVMDALQKLNATEMTPELRWMTDDLLGDDMRDFKRLARKGKKDTFKANSLERLLNSDLKSDLKSDN